MTIIQCSFCESKRALIDKQSTETGQVGSLAERKWFTQMDCWTEALYWEGRLIEKQKRFFCSPLCHANWMIQRRQQPRESLKPLYEAWFHSQDDEFEEVKTRTFALIDSFDKQIESVDADAQQQIGSPEVESSSS
jgi:hypothetical protein